MRRLVLLSTLLALPALAQDLELPTLSPRAEVKQQVGVTWITVNYSSPCVKGRTVYGELVPFGTLWRTGANGATTIELSGDATIGGQAVPAGKYAIFTIPGQTEWTVIINKNPNQGGTGSYDQKLDQARFTAKPEAVPTRERLTFLFSDTTDAAASLDLDWAGTRVRLPITVATAANAKANIGDFSKKSSRALANAARYLADDAKDVDGALKLIDSSLAVDVTWFNTWLKADFLARKGDKKAALALAEKAYALGKDDKGFFYKDRVEKALKDWK